MNSNMQSTDKQIEIEIFNVSRLLAEAQKGTGIKFPDVVNNIAHTNGWDFEIQGESLNPKGNASPAEMKSIAQRYTFWNASAKHRLVARFVFEGLLILPTGSGSQAFFNAQTLTLFPEPINTTIVAL